MKPAKARRWTKRKTDFLFGRCLKGNRKDTLHFGGDVERYTHVCLFIFHQGGLVGVQRSMDSSCSVKLVWSRAHTRKNPFGCFHLISLQPTPRALKTPPSTPLYPSPPQTSTPVITVKALRDHKGFCFGEHARGGDVLTKAGTP